MSTCTVEHLKELIRDVPDFPKEGIIFKDITPLLLDHSALAFITQNFAEQFADKGITKVLGIESRGFIFAPLVAQALDCGFAPIRKAGKLPWDCHRVEYGLEYGQDIIEIHSDALNSNDSVLILDDVLATGGTIGAAIDLVQRCEAKIASAAFVVNLSFLGGDQKLNCPQFSILEY